MASVTKVTHGTMQLDIGKGFAESVPVTRTERYKSGELHVSGQLPIAVTDIELTYDDPDTLVNILLKDEPQPFDSFSIDLEGFVWIGLLLRMPTKPDSSDLIEVPTVIPGDSTRVSDFAGNTIGFSPGRDRVTGYMRQPAPRQLFADHVYHDIEWRAADNDWGTIVGFAVFESADSKLPLLVSRVHASQRVDHGMTMKASIAITGDIT